MTNPQAWQGDYTQLRFYPSRGVCAVTVEIPLEEGTAFVAAFGTPLPKSGIPIALARINSFVKAEIVPTETNSVQVTPETKTDKAKRKWDELSIAQQAGIRCAEKRFQVFVGEQMAKTRGAGFRQDLVGVEDAAWFVRTYCGVNSRAHIENDAEAIRKFNDLMITYDNWASVLA